MAQIENAFAGLVITAEAFNPSIFSETWLVQNGIVIPNGFEGLRVFSGDLVQFQTADMQVLVAPPRLQITFPIPQSGEQPRAPLEAAKKIVALLPHTPYQALGVNFDFFVVHPSDQNICAYSRALLGGGQNPLLQEFSSSDARFGGYFSKDYGETRLKLDIKPIKAGPDSKDLLRFSFNFTCDLSQLETNQRSGRIAQIIGSWATLHEYAQRLVQIGATLQGPSK